MTWEEISKSQIPLEKSELQISIELWEESRSKDLSIEIEQGNFQIELNNDVVKAIFKMLLNHKGVD